MGRVSDDASSSLRRARAVLTDVLKMSKSKQMAVARDVLHERFQLGDFRPGQEAVISALLDGRSALAVFPTGGGKSLCYQLPALLLDGVTLVVSPLIALMKDQVDGLQALGIPAAKLDSTMGADEQAAVMAEVRAGRVRLLYVAPERLANRRFLTELEGLNLAMMAIDEAHCISEWGHNFRPDYLRLERLAPAVLLALFLVKRFDHSQGGKHLTDHRHRGVVHFFLFSPAGSQWPAVEFIDAYYEGSHDQRHHCQLHIDLCRNINH